jgi:putative aldouronate transport system substrate-binding protein
MLFNWEDEDLVTTYGTNIEKYFPDALEANRTLNDDGKIYGIGHGIASQSGEHDLFFYDWGTRWDLYKQLGYPEVKDLDDLADVLGQMKKICPTGDDGKSTYGVSIWPDWDGDMVMYVKALASGYTGYDELGIGLYDSKTGKFYDCLDENGPYMEALRFFNKLYQNGLLDPDSMTQTYDTMIAKVRNGDVLFSIFDYAGSTAFNSDQHIQANEYMAPLVPTDAHDIVYALNTTGNERIWSIGSNCAYPERAMQLIDWLCTPEGGMTLWYGIKGLMWDYDKDGNTYFTDLGKKCAADASCDLTGTQWTSPYTGKTYTLDGTFNDGMLQMNNITWAQGATNPDSNGEKFSSVTWASQIGEAKNDTEADWRTKTGAKSTQEYLDSTNYTMVPKVNMAASEKSSELDLKWQQVTKAICEGSWNAMYAKSDAEFTQIVSQMRKSCDGYGYSDCVKWCQDEAAKRFSLQ